VIRVICSCIGNIIQHLFSVQAVSLRNSKETNGTESALCIDVKAFTLPTTHVYWELACHCERVTQLRLSRPELPKEFSDRTGFDAT